MSSTIIERGHETDGARMAGTKCGQTWSIAHEAENFHRLG
jgi:hypothetical protein